MKSYCLSVCLVTILAVASSTPAATPFIEDRDNMDTFERLGGTPISPDDPGEEVVTDKEITIFLQRMSWPNQLPQNAGRKFPPLSSFTNSAPTTEETGATSLPDGAVKEAKSPFLDVTVVLVIGVTAASLLVLLTVVVIVVFVCRRGKGKQDLSLNKDLNRWDPQLLRPSKKDMDAFIFGPPIPSVAEMIK